MLFGFPGGRKSQYWLSARPNGPSSRTPAGAGGGGCGAVVAGGGDAVVVVAALFEEPPQAASATSAAHANALASGRAVRRIRGVRRRTPAMVRRGRGGTAVRATRYRAAPPSPLT